MIYLDNSATSLHRPPGVEAAVSHALRRFGNPGRSFYTPALEATRAVFQARVEIAALVGLDDPLRVAFTANATESLNLVLNSLIGPGDGVITSVLEHNSVLRPLYRIGCPLSFLDCDDSGSLLLDTLPELVTASTRFVVVTHGSNLVGSLTCTDKLSRFCRERGLVLILDVSQTLGCVETRADSGDILCFTGHKALMGPQGTGGIIVPRDLPFRLVKTGGSGADSFAPHQALTMPDIFEAGTHNAHGLWGLRAGAAFLKEVGVREVERKEAILTRRFLEGLKSIRGIRVYGPGAEQRRLPVIALNLDGIPAEDLAMRLWEGWEIATRAGSHCAPLAHRRFGTEQTGMVRFSFGYYNTVEEIDTALEALEQIAAEINR